LLTELQPEFRNDSRSKRCAFTVIALLCLTLLTIIQVAHVHAPGSDADRCPVCIAMQSAAPVAIAAAVIVLVRIEAAAPRFEARAIIRYWHPKLFTRPPPIGC
jgi:hypothetical protein